MSTRSMPTRRRSRSSGRIINGPPLAQLSHVTRESTNQNGTTSQNGTRGRNGTNGRSGSTSGNRSRGRSVTRGKSRSNGKNGSNDKSGSNGKTNKKNNNVVPLAVKVNSTIAMPIVTRRNGLMHRGLPIANKVSSPGGTLYANYRKKLTNEYLPEYPNYNSESSISEESNSESSTSEEMNAANAARIFNRLYPPVRTRSDNRPEYNVGAYRTRRNPIGQRESF